MEITSRVFDALKPRVASFGFTKKELQSVAAVIADNLSLDENAEEEVVDAAIDKAVNTMVPVLQLAQSQASRAIEKFKVERKQEEQDGQEDDENGEAAKPTARKTPPATKPQPPQDSTPTWAQNLICSVAKLETELGSLKNEKLTTSRKQRLETALKDTGAFGSQTLRSFNKMKFDNDEEFDEYLSDVETSVREFRKEQSNAGLKALEKHPAKGGEKTEELTDSEIDKIVAAL